MWIDSSNDAHKYCKSLGYKVSKKKPIVGAGDWSFHGKDGRIMVYFNYVMSKIEFHIRDGEGWSCIGNLYLKESKEKVILINRDIYTYDPSDFEDFFIGDGEIV